MKLADFGVAARISEGPDGDELSLSVVGTPYWMAPEVHCGARSAACARRVQLLGEASDTSQNLAFLRLMLMASCGGSGSARKADRSQPTRHPRR